MCAKVTQCALPLWDTEEQSNLLYRIWQSGPTATVLMSVMEFLLPFWYSLGLGYHSCDCGCQQNASYGRPNYWISKARNKRQCVCSSKAEEARNCECLPSKRVLRSQTFKERRHLLFAVPHNVDICQSRKLSTLPGRSLISINSIRMFYRISIPLDWVQ